MKHKLVIDPQGSLDSVFDMAGFDDWAFFLPNVGQPHAGLPQHPTFGPSATDAAPSPTSYSTESGPVELLGTPPLVSEALESSTAQSGATTVVAMNTGGITINLLFDAAAMAAPASFRAGIQQAASLLTAAISD